MQPGPEHGTATCAMMPAGVAVRRRSDVMRLAEGIRRHGFRKWYERELLQSHAHLALTFLCMIGIVAGFESMTRGASWSERLADLVTVLLSAGAGLWALRRYLYLLMHAEEMANQANCGQCKAYGLLLVPDDARNDARGWCRCAANAAASAGTCRTAEPLAG